MIRAIFALFMAISFALPAHAWGPTGHRVVGALAEPYLSEEAKSQIHSILGTESLAETSTWPDFMRSSRDPFWRSEASSYHFVTVPDGKTYSEVGAPPEGDAVTALNKFSETLRSTLATREEKALALRFIVHLVGDLHQPLHAGNGKDRGGTRFNVLFFEELTNLHLVWDEGIINRERLSYSEKSAWLARRITPEQRQEWWSNDPLVWIEESATLRQTIYPDNQILSWQYVYDHTGEIDMRLSQAGVRLAAYLNSIFQPAE